MTSAGSEHFGFQLGAPKPPPATRADEWQIIDMATEFAIDLESPRDCHERLKGSNTSARTEGYCYIGRLRLQRPARGISEKVCHADEEPRDEASGQGRNLHRASVPSSAVPIEVMSILHIL